MIIAPSAFGEICSTQLTRSEVDVLSLGALDVQKYAQKRLTCVGIIMININIAVVVIQSCRFRASSERILATFAVTEVGLALSPLRKDSTASVPRYLHTVWSHDCGLLNPNR